MSGAKTLDVIDELSWTARGTKISMALRATRVGRGCQASVAPMFCVARGTTGRECLIGVMRGTIMATAASLVTSLGAERAGLLYMALATSCCEHGVSGGHLATAVNAIVVSQRG